MNPQRLYGGSPIVKGDYREEKLSLAGLAATYSPKS